MELASLFLLILLPPADATGESAMAIQAALHDQLGEVTMAVAPDSVVTPAMWQQEKSQLRARFVAHLTWKGRDRASVELVALAAAGPGDTVTRELSFASHDGKTERGRAIGLVIAALLRESPASTWLGARPVGAAASPAHPGFVLGGMFAAERVRVGNWAMGPELLYDFSLADWFRVRASVRALFGGQDSYMEVGGGLGASWDFLRAQDGHHALGLGLRLEAFHEATNVAGDNASNDSTWNASVGPSLGGRITLWRSLRLVGEAALRTSLARMTLTVGEDSSRRTYTYTRWRPILAVGLEYAL